MRGKRGARRPPALSREGAPHPPIHLLTPSRATPLSQALLHPPAALLDDPAWPAPCLPCSPDDDGAVATPHPPAQTPAPAGVALPAPLALGTTARWVATPSGLAAAAAALASAARVGGALGIDVEHYQGRDAYHGRVCTIQVAAGGVTWVIDALALGRPLLDPHPSSPGGVLRALMACPATLKLFHGGAADLSWLARDVGWRFGAGAVWDTAPAARAAGLGGDGLAAVLGAASAAAAAGAAAGRYDAAAAAGLAAAAAGAARDKQGGRAGAGAGVGAALRLGDWRDRPLPAPRLLYAARDAHYLAFAAASLAARCGGDWTVGSRAGAWAGLSGWVPPAPAATARAGAARALKAAAGARPSAAAAPAPAFADAVLALSAWRDGVARRADVSPPSVLPDGALVALASSGGGRRGGGGAGGAAGVRELAAGGESAAAAALVLAIAAASAGPDTPLPHLTEAAAAGVVAALEAAAAGAVRWWAGEAGGPLPNHAGPSPRAAAAAAAARASLRRARAIERFRCKRSVYEDCRLYSSEGTLLCCCDRNKSEF